MTPGSPIMSIAAGHPRATRPPRLVAASLLAAACCLIFPASAFATNWYVDAAKGNDSNAGTSLASAFKTIKKATTGNAALAAGDTIMLAAGLYRERVQIINKVNGTASQPITVKAISQPVAVDGSAAVTAWTLVAGEIYKAQPGFPVRAVVVDDTPLLPVAPLGSGNGPAPPYATYDAVAAAGLWSAGRYLYEESTGNLYVWAPGGGDPSAHQELGVIDATHDTSRMVFYLWNQDYWVFDGLTLQFGDQGISVAGTTGGNITLKNCTVRYTNHSGVINVKTALQNVVRHAMMNNWPRGREPWGSAGGGWGGGLTVNPNGGLADRNTVSMSGGEGILAYNGSGAGGAVLQNNTVFNNYSAQLYVDNYRNPVVQNNFIYSSPDPSWTTNNGHASDQFTLGISKRLRGTGLTTGNEDYYGGYCNMENAVIRNNIIVGARQGITYNAEGACRAKPWRNVKVVHNTIVVPNARQSGLPDAGNGDNYSGLRLFESAAATGNVIQNNIIYASEPWSFLIVQTGGNGMLTGYTVDHNLLYHAGRDNSIYWNGALLTHDQWVALAGAAHGSGDVTADPKLVSLVGLTAASFQLSGSASPAVDAGAAMLDVQYDFSGRPRPQGAGWDVGACEFASIQFIADPPPAPPSNPRIVR